MSSKVFNINYRQQYKHQNGSVQMFSLSGGLMILPLRVIIVIIIAIRPRYKYHVKSPKYLSGISPQKF